MNSSRSINCSIAVQNLKLSLDGVLLVTHHDDNAIRFWDTATFNFIHKIPFEERIRDFTLSPNNSFISTITASDLESKPVSTTSTMHVHELTTYQRVYSRSMADCRCVTFIDQQTMAIGRLSRGKNEKLNSLDFYAIKDFKRINTIHLPYRELALELVTIPRHHILLSLGIGLAVYDFGNRKLLNHIHCENIEVDWDIWETTCLTVSHSASLVALGFDTYHRRSDGGKRVCILDSDAWKVKSWYVEGVKFPTNLAISDNGRFLATMLSDSNSIIITNIQSNTIAARFELDNVSAIAFLPQSNSLIAGSRSEQPLVVLGQY